MYCVFDLISHAYSFQDENLRSPYFGFKNEPRVRELGPVLVQKREFNSRIGKLRNKVIQEIKCLKLIYLLQTISQWWNIPLQLPEMPELWGVFVFPLSLDKSFSFRTYFWIPLLFKDSRRETRLEIRREFSWEFSRWKFTTPID